MGREDAPRKAENDPGVLPKWSSQEGGTANYPRQENHPLPWGFAFKRNKCKKATLSFRATSKMPRQTKITLKSAPRTLLLVKLVGKIKRKKDAALVRAIVEKKGKKHKPGGLQKNPEGKSKLGEHRESGWRAY